VFGAREAAWPQIRHDLGLSYAQVGVALSVPGLVSVVVEPAIGIFGDRGLRRRLVLGGGALFAVTLVATALAPGYLVLLAAFTAMYPASGAFVSLSQATLMDVDPANRERNMARWTLAGAVGVSVGPLLVATGAPWRAIFVAYAVFAAILVVLARPLPFDGADPNGGGFRAALRELRNPRVVRWLFLLELQDLGGDILYGYLALYFVDAVGVDARTAALAVAAWTGADLVGNVIVLRFLDRVGGLRWLRASALAVAVVFPAFQLVDGLAPKLVLIALLGALHSGWYPISKARLYETLPGRSGTAMALGTTTGALGAVLPLGLGLLAERVGIHDAFWLVLVAPLAMLAFVPRHG
jgi:FSR family fosmidomycin resistance protein-like MFS transporter